MQFLGHDNMSTTSGFYAFATLEMMSDAMNKATSKFDGTEKIWKQEAVRRAIYSLD
jgi:integrase/recombinase XerD